MGQFVADGGIPSPSSIDETLVERHTAQVQERLAKVRVAIAGLGGLGSNIAVSLARIGVGSLLLVDCDTVDLGNLNRQHYFIEHLGSRKTDALESILMRINPYLQVETKHVRVTEDDVVALFSGFEIVCEAFDDSAAKAMLVNGILERLPDTKVVSGSGMAGFESSNLMRTRRVMRNLYLCGDQESGIEQGGYLMAPRVQICAGLQANMVTRLLLGIEEE